MRVRVKGGVPAPGYANFISPELVGQARRRRIQPADVPCAPKISAVDPARFGDDLRSSRRAVLAHLRVALSGFDGADLSQPDFRDRAQVKARSRASPTTPSATRRP